MMMGLLLVGLLMAAGFTPQSEQPGLVDAITSLFERFSAGTKLLFQRLSAVMTDLFLFVSRTIYTSLIVGGLFLNLTRLNRRLGSDWIKGGILLGLVSELAPYLFRALS